MATFRTKVRRDQKRSDGTMKVIIQVIHNRGNANIHNSWYVRDCDLKKDGTIKNSKVNIAISKYILELQEWCMENAMLINGKTAKELVALLERKDETFSLDFVSFVRERASSLIENGRAGTGKLRLSAINSFIKYAGTAKYDINKITASTINGWMSWIMRQPAPKGKRGTRAPRLYYNQLRVCFNEARQMHNDEDAGTINIPRNPFERAVVPKETIAEKRALPTDLIRNISLFPYEKEYANKTSRFNLAKDVFLLSFCLMGMNTVDLFNCTELHGNKLIYERTKTRTRRSDKARIEITLPDVILHIFNKYKDDRSDYVFKFHRMYSTPGTFNAALNKGLKQIGKRIGVENLQFYAARHSWATIAVNDCRIDKYTVHQALNHVGDKTSITDVYIKKDWRITDDANKKVLDYVFNF